MAKNTKYGDMRFHQQYAIQNQHKLIYSIKKRESFGVNKSTYKGLVGLHNTTNKSSKHDSECACVCVPSQSGNVNKADISSANQVDRALS